MNRFPSMYTCNLKTRIDHLENGSKNIIPQWLIWFSLAFKLILFFKSSHQQRINRLPDDYSCRIIIFFTRILIFFKKYLEKHGNTSTLLSASHLDFSIHLYMVGVNDDSSTLRQAQCTASLTTRILKIRRNATPMPIGGGRRIFHFQNTSQMAIEYPLFTIHF